MLGCANAGFPPRLAKPCWGFHKKTGISSTERRQTDGCITELCPHHAASEVSGLTLFVKDVSSIVTRLESNECGEIFEVSNVMKDGMRRWREASGDPYVCKTYAGSAEATFSSATEKDNA